MLVYESFLSWRHSHAVHHASAGDLDRRGVGDVPTMTVAEYHSSSWEKRLGYRLFRNPLYLRVEVAPEDVDEVIVSIAPVTLGGGAPLLPRRIELRLEELGRNVDFACARFSVVRPSG